MEIDTLTDLTFSLTLENHVPDALSTAQPPDSERNAAPTSSQSWNPSSKLWGTLNPDPSVALSEILSRHGPSDLEVHTSDGKEYRVHKQIVCSSCKFFDNAANGTFKEARTGIVELFHDPPAAIRLLLQFLYTNRYNYFVSDNDEPSAPICLFHLDVYVLAVIYQLPELKKLAKVSFLTSLFERKSLAASVIPPAIITLYQSTPESDRDLRDFFEDYGVRHLPMLLQNPSFLELMVTCAPYRRGVARATHLQRRRVARLENHIADLQVQVQIPEFEAKQFTKKHHCPTKGCRVMMRSRRLMAMGDVFCSGCNTISDTSDWKVDDNKQRCARPKR